MTVDHGLIVLGDVSGYTEFIATTELQHSREILAELLGTLCECAPGNLRVAQLERMPSSGCPTSTVRASRSV
ncbi:MAG: hypothetical protein ACRDG6_14400 [Candidatus Limnocylindria bacterium]